VLGSRVLVLGLTFKENCPDVRNTKAVDIVTTLRSYNADIDVYDPWINVEEAEAEYGLACLREAPRHDQYDAIVLAVPHHQFVTMGVRAIKAFGKPHAVLFDVKGILPRSEVDARL
jgi:UDP-N-acetyl-D-galactosamine dehydrogenase